MTKTYGPFGLHDFGARDRVEIAPHLDLWMMGDRYGTIVEGGKKYLRVRMDKTGMKRIKPEDIYAVIE